MVETPGGALAKRDDLPAARDAPARDRGDAARGHVHLDHAAPAGGRRTAGGPRARGRAALRGEHGRGGRRLLASAGSAPSTATTSATTRSRTSTSRCRRSIRSQIGGMSGRLATRMGAAIRHATARFDGIESRRRLLLILSDGRPEDYDDGGDRRYLHEDTRMAVKEAVAKGVHPFCITVDTHGATSTCRRSSARATTWCSTRSTACRTSCRRSICGCGGRAKSLHHREHGEHRGSDEHCRKTLQLAYSIRSVNFDEEMSELEFLESFPVRICGAGFCL